MNYFRLRINSEVLNETLCPQYNENVYNSLFTTDRNDIKEFLQSILLKRKPGYFTFNAYSLLQYSLFEIILSFQKKDSIQYGDIISDVETEFSRIEMIDLDFSKYFQIDNAIIIGSSLEGLKAIIKEIAAEIEIGRHISFSSQGDYGSSKFYELILIPIIRNLANKALKLATTKISERFPGNTNFNLIKIDSPDLFMRLYNNLKNERRINLEEIFPYRICQYTRANYSVYLRNKYGLIEIICDKNGNIIKYLQ
jgi:hypothetical protein